MTLTLTLTLSQILTPTLALTLTLTLTLTTDPSPNPHQERRQFGSFYYRFPLGGESGADVYDRVSNFMESLYRHWSEHPQARREGLTRTRSRTRSRTRTRTRTLILPRSTTTCS